MHERDGVGGGLRCSTLVRKCDHPRRGTSIHPSIPPTLRPISQPAAAPLSSSQPGSPARWSVRTDRGVPRVSARRPPPGVRRSAGDLVQVPAGLRLHPGREPWIGPSGETRLDPLSDAGDAGSDGATEHLLGHHRHSFRRDP